MSPVDDRKSLPVIRIQATEGWFSVNLRELWDFRELLYFLVWRDIKVRYKETAVGVAWILLQPLAMMLVFTVFFGKLARIPSGSIPYPVFVLSGLLPWQFFSRAISECAASLIFDQRLVSKVYFPRLLIPIAKVLAGLIDFMISVTLLVVLMLFYDVSPGKTVFLVPLFVLLMVTAALGIGSWLAALNIEFRDFGVALPFLIQLWMFLSPVVYPSDMVPEQWRMLYGLNPVAGMVEGFRWSLFGAEGALSASMLTASCLVSLVVLVGGLLWFRRRERLFTDILG